MQLRVVSWNVDSTPTGSLDAKVQLLTRLRPDVAILQELGRSVYRGLMPHPSAYARTHLKERLFSWGALSTDLCRPRGSEFRLGCAVLGRSTTALVDSYVLGDAPFGVSEPVRHGFLGRTVATQVALASGDTLTVCSFHDRKPSATPAHELQRAFHTGIAGWLRVLAGPVVFGIDAGPAFDGADPLIGAEAGHALRRVGRDCRDELWASADVEVVDVCCLLDDAKSAGSSHGLLVADLAIG